jgi:branched-chain amino acid transport system ATP-binding protein
MAILVVEQLVVRYGQVMALDHVSLEIGDGEIVALVGANGAGKSTVIRAIVGQVEPASGTVRFLGHAMAGLAPWQRARRGIGLSPEGRRIFPGLTVHENLEVAAECSAIETARRIAEIFALFPALREREAALGWQLSGGQQQMLAIGRALISNPRLLLLDEPSLGLAPSAVHDLYATIRRTAAAGRSVLIADQNAAAAFAIADRVYVLQTGHVAAHGKPAEIQENSAIATAFFGES